MSRNFDNIDPTLLADLDEEAKFAETLKRNKFMPRLKIERGQGYLVRFLPVEIGTNKSWLGRAAQHWVNGRAIYCKQYTSVYLGGDPNYQCPLCKLYDNASNHDNEQYRKNANKIAANIFWFGVVIAIAKDSGKGRPSGIKEPDCWIAHEVTMFKNQFEQLRSIASRFAVQGTKGILDFKTGHDIWFNRTGRGYTLQDDGPHPICEKEEQMQQVVNTIWESITIPQIEMPSKDVLTEFFAKAKDFITRGGDGGNTPQSGGRFSKTDDDSVAEIEHQESNGRSFARGSHQSNESELESNLDSSLEDPVPQKKNIPPSAPISTPPALNSKQAPSISGSITPPPVSTEKTIVSTAAPTVEIVKVEQPQKSKLVSVPRVGDTADSDDENELPLETSDQIPPADEVKSAPIVSEPPPKIESPGGTRLASTIRSRLAKVGAVNPPTV